MISLLALPATTRSTERLEFIPVPLEQYCFNSTASTRLGNWVQLLLALATSITMGMPILQLDRQPSTQAELLIQDWPQFILAPPAICFINT